MRPSRSHRARVGAFVLAILALVVAPRARDQVSPAPVKTTGGLVAGTTASVPGVTAFLGIPYAAPPVGALRWREPQPAPAWTGVRQATEFGTSCMQAQPGSRLPWTEEYMTQNAVGEDCLNLNVWRPAGRAARPRAVMVWIYGGGFNEGSSAVAVYDGAALAARGVVVVSLNYRVGVLGGLAHPELTAESPHKVSGNYGILDQVAALRWVRDNIAAFGGDPANVTIFGQSAGGVSVAMLMRSPLARGLFVRAIGMAGPGLIGASGPGRGGTLAEREAAGVKFAQAQGASSLAELRALPATTFIAPAVSKGNAVPPAWPLIDGHVIATEAPASQVPVMVGFTADDIGTNGGGLGGPPPQPSLAAWRADAEKAWGPQAAAFLALYPAATDADVPAARKAAGRDRTRVTMDRWAASQVQASRTVYTYYFDRVTPWPEHPEFGAHHTSEVPYVFGTVGRGKRAWEPVDRIVSDRMASYFVNFARTGDPNGAGLPRWPAWAPGAHVTMRLGEAPGPMPVATPERRAFLEQGLRP
ncbi:carboxylic ester hydrolase [Luteitalea sp. TBR-22]|uniref:carboxylesterase/lipase family protein n=1 Tax=Luteitalea sp. TBR-22 TaxID=2802971 RepID=UPI001AFBF53F|nr:carboxylesterase family protein [Luteitalea sp. TBR-22]BCS32498.1 carboxylic ester hydrolase [Luteitalea sp. TBR-22]